jgi:outer membrane immunogenic protein
MMKRSFVLGAVLTCVVASSVMAADMPTKAPTARPACAAASWQGGYAGVSGGGVSYTANRTDQDEVLLDAATYVQKKWGGLVGGQVGYNWTNCNTFWGMEIDGSWSNTRVTTFLDPEDTNGNTRVTSRLKALATGRVRAGAALDNLLLYGTGGVAAARINTTWADGSDDAQVHIKEWRWGWVAGLGTEWALTDRISLRSEVLYVDFVDRRHRVPFFPDGTLANFTHSDSAWITRVGLNVKFGGPVAAGY